MEKTHFRSVAVDIMKGIGIILVVLGHTIHGKLGGWIYTFHMPLFFMVAGLFLRPGKDVFAKRAKSLLVPYLIFAVATYVYWRFLEMRFRPAEDGLDPNRHFLDIFWQVHEFKFDVVLWFLPCLFLTTALANVVLMYVKNKWAIAAICAVWIVAVSLYMPDTQSRWIKETMCAFPFLTVGFLLGDRLPAIEAKVDATPLYMRILAVLPLVAIAFVPHGGDIHSSTFPNGYAYFAVCAVVCVAAVYVLSTTLTTQKWLSWLGRNTLVVMCLHDPLKRIVCKVFAAILHQDTDAVRESVIASILITAIVILIIVPICKLVNKRLPWVLGRF